MGVLWAFFSRYWWMFVHQQGWESGAGSRDFGSNLDPHPTSLTVRWWICIECGKRSPAQQRTGRVTTCVVTTAQIPPWDSIKGCWLACCKSYGLLSLQNCSNTCIYTSINMIFHQQRPSLLLLLIVLL